MISNRDQVWRIAGWTCLAFAVCGLVAGFFVGFIYDPALAWLSALLGALELGVVGVCIGAVLGLVVYALRAAGVCPQTRHSQY